MVETKRKPPVIAQCIKLARSHPAGVLLYRMVWWNSRQKVEYGVQQWLVNASEWWANEAALTPKQLKTAMAGLKKRRLIKSEIHLFENRTQAFIQLTGKALKGYDAGPLEGDTGKALEGQSYKKGVLERRRPANHRSRAKKRGKMKVLREDRIK